LISFQGQFGKDKIILCAPACCIRFKPNFQLSSVRELMGPQRQRETRVKGQRMLEEAGEEAG